MTKHVKSGWKINKDSVDKILPDLEKTLAQTPENIPVIIQGLDNSAYLGATDDGGMAPLSQCVPKDKGFHAVGALVVASEVDLVNGDAAEPADHCIRMQTGLHFISDAKVHHHALL